MPIPVDAPPIRTTLLRDSVHDRLRDLIVEGTLAPGEVCLLYTSDAADE